MKKLITVTIMAIAAFSWFVTHKTTEPEKDLPTNATFIIKSNRSGTCKVSTMATAARYQKECTHRSVQGTIVIDIASTSGATSC
ncbi:hypothetical protein [Pectobacterium carotovorum]|uniref:hypothetical protein n=1 Tax=Pectobacterium carotovorum TaxID=554 RepID=UPI00215B1C67|nr:hypothetical protein [Pectobacterium carotovorum]